jgi:hypothetical protein
MKKITHILIVLTVFTSAISAQSQESHLDPLKESVILYIDSGSRVYNDDMQRMFTALAASYLKNNTSYFLAYEVFREAGKQNGKPSLGITDLDYGDFSIINIRYTFSNGYFEFKMAKSPFTNIVNNEVVNSVDYNGDVGEDLYKAINNKLQEAVYIARGYAKRYGKTSSASFYLFRSE